MVEDYMSSGRHSGICWTNEPDWKALPQEVWQALPESVIDQDKAVAVQSASGLIVLTCERDGEEGTQARRLRAALSYRLEPPSTTVLASDLLITGWVQAYTALTTEGSKVADGGSQSIGHAWSTSTRAATLTRQLVEHAMHSGTTDIHLEARTQAASLRLRFRIDGELHDMPCVFSLEDADLLANYLFSQGRRGNSHWQPERAQDGVTDVTLADGKRVELRLAVLPEVRGWDLIIRLIDYLAELPLPQDLGYSVRQFRILQQAIESPAGAIIFAGPAGSGKSTSMLSLVQTLPANRKIASLEQPVERLLGGVSQVTAAVSSDLGSIAPALNRWDCDITILGEVRDRYTASALCDFITSGRLTLATLHARGAAQVPGRLVELGVNRSLLEEPGFISAIVYQRLVPKLCQHCCLQLTKLPDSDPRRATQAYKKLSRCAASHRLYLRGAGCQNCQLGHRGRVLVAEVIEGETLAQGKGWLGLTEHGSILARRRLIDPLAVRRWLGPLVDEKRAQEASSRAGSR